MIGVIVLSGPFPGMHGLDAERSPSLLPVCDRPAIQHIVESLVTQGVTAIELIVGHAPERVEALLGNGDRWGCRFRYHLAGQPERPYRSLKVIADIAVEPWILIHAERYPCMDFQLATEPKTTLYFAPDAVNPGERERVSGEGPTGWGGTALLPAGFVTDTIANCTPSELKEHLGRLVQNGSATVISTTDWLDVSSPDQLLKSQAKVLAKKLSGLLISGTERQPGVWISRNVTIHRSAVLHAPLYVGPNSRLGKGVSIGPNAVIGPDCIVDSNTSVNNALILSGSYVGEALEVHNAIVSHNLLVNVHLDASIDISEDFLLGRLERPQSPQWTSSAFGSVTALLLIVILLPVSIISFLYFALLKGISYRSLAMLAIPTTEKLPSREYLLQGMGADAWSVFRPAGWGAFTRQFLPGLFAVLCGRLSFVGFPPRTKEEVADLSEDWRKIYVEGKAGLITEASLAVTDGADEMQFYLADAYYSVRRNRRYDLGLALKYFSRLILGKRRTS